MDLIDVARYGAQFVAVARAEMRCWILTDQRRRVACSLQPRVLWVSGEERCTAGMCHITNRLTLTGRRVGVAGRTECSVARRIVHPEGHGCRPVW